MRNGRDGGEKKNRGKKKKRRMIKIVATNVLPLGIER